MRMRKNTLTFEQWVEYIGALVLALCVAFIYSDYRAEKVVTETEVGEVLYVGSDVCSRLRAKGYIAADTHCGYRRGNVRVVVTQVPE